MDKFSFNPEELHEIYQNILKVLLMKSLKM